tara:strand:+ start:1434 stop:2765 length:1332 start_codon:yes stop_codon:yes gene_type:complete
MAAIDRSLYKQFDIISADEGNLVDISGGIVAFSYFENLFSPMVTAQVIVANTGETLPDGDGGFTSLYNGLPLRGGEKVNIKISSNSNNNQDLEFTQINGNELYVASITDVNIDATRETFVLNLVSREAITNETSRVGKKFPTSQKISDSVKDIIKEYLLSEKEVFVDETENPYGFIGNLKKPFTILTWLASKSVPANVAGQSSSAGFFFFETKEGFHFKSIDSLIASEPFKQEYVFSPNVVEQQNPDSDFNIIKYSTNKNQNLINNLERGSYCTYRMYYNPLDSTFTSPQQGIFKLSDYVDRIENLGSDFSINLPPMDKKGKSLGDIPSRFMTGVLDYGTIERKDKNSLKKNADPMEYQSQAMMRYNILHTVEVVMTIPLNSVLSAGDLIKCKFAKVSTTDDKKIDDEQSGLYMIKEIVHYFESKGSYTKLKLVRDTFGKRSQ